MRTHRHITTLIAFFAFALSAIAELPKTKWAPGKPVRQALNGCNPAALCNWLRCEPTKKQLPIAYCNEQWFKPAMNAHGASSLEDILKYAKKNGDIRGYEYKRQPSIDEMKIRLATGPVIIGHAWFDQMYDRSHGTITCSGKLISGHTWIVYAWNPKGRIYSCESSWGDNTPYFVREDDLKRLLSDKYAEMAVPRL